MWLVKRIAAEHGCKEHSGHVAATICAQRPPGMSTVQESIQRPAAVSAKVGGRVALAAIPDDMAFVADPVRGRLTVNTFLMAESARRD